MKEWEYHFPPTSKADWIRLIERDLKGKPLSSLHSSWWPGQVLEPIHHADDNHPVVRLPSHLFAKPPAIIESINANGLTATQLNQRLLDALQFGTVQFILTMDPMLFASHDAWLQGVYPELVTWQIICDNITAEVFEKFSGRTKGNAFLCIDRGADAKRMDGFENVSTIPRQWIYQIPSAEEWLEGCADALHRYREDYSSWNDNEPCNCEWHMEADPDYLKCLVQVRALNVIIQNVIADQKNSGQHGGEGAIRLVCHIRPGENESPDAYLVRATTSALAANLAGASGLCIHHHEHGAAEHYRRNNRNIHHLLHMESGLPKQTDPLAGAYALDHYTAAWAAAIWENPDKK